MRGSWAMPTRKETLEDLRYEMERLSDSVQDNTYAQDEPREVNVHVDTSGLDNALSHLGDSIVRAVLTGIGGFIGGMLLAYHQQQEMMVAKLLFKFVRELNRKSEMIDSIQRLQKQEESLSYQFLVDRSYAEGTTKDHRQTILNGLISDGIVTKCGLDEFEIDPDGPRLADFRERLDGVWEGLSLLNTYCTATGSKKELALKKLQSLSGAQDIRDFLDDSEDDDKDDEDGDGDDDEDGEYGDGEYEDDNDEEDEDDEDE
jgi:hypothetical protein